MVNSSSLATKYPQISYTNNLAKLRTVSLTVSELVNFVSAFMYLWNYVYETAQAAIIFPSYFVVDCEPK